jgi:hypothetical protein
VSIPSCAKVEEDKASYFAIRSLEKKEIPTYDMCLVPFVENPLQESHLSHIKPT